MMMCLISCYAPGVMPVADHLENGMALNPHGSGFAIGSAMARSLNPEKMLLMFLRLRKQYPGRPAVFHSRSATGDSPVTEANCHPFRNEGMIASHNGYLFPHDGERSDSRIFAGEVLPLYDLDDRKAVALLERRMGPNKAVILRGLSPALILNKRLGITLDDGTWHSNSDYLGVSHHVPGSCPQCNAETDCKPVCASCERKAQGRRALLMKGAK